MVTEDDEDDEPDLDGGPISFEAYCEGVPEKLEHVDGLLISGADAWGRERREKLLRLLLRNVGLVRTLELAPLAKWERALEVVRRQGR